MENLKKVSRAQWCLFALLFGFAFLMQNCQDDDALIYEENQTETELNAKPPIGNKVDVCRFNERKGTYSVVSILSKFVPDKLLPGDVIIDADGDGYAAYNECGVLIGNGIDCNDNDPAINPGAVEICGDGIDNDCNGEIDECTYVPDDNFELTLITKGFDDTLDNYVFTKNINTVKYLSVNYYEGYSPGKIADLTGIGGFTALETLECNYNQLTSLNVSGNTALTSLYCNYNQLTSLDVSNNTSLAWLYCGVNQLASIDVSKNTALKLFSCGVNQLTSLDVSKNTALEGLYFSGNKLTGINLSANTSLRILHADDNQLRSLDVSSNTALATLYCYNNQLTSLDVSNNPNLSDFYCHNNQLTSLDVSFNTNLYWLACGQNQLTSIDISNNTALDGLWIEDNQLASLDVSQNTVLTYLECFNNTPLTCIKVNSAQLATAPTDSYWIIGDGVIYSLDCSSE
jgi:Leucine-rich repeat (LRR) protein